MFSVQVKLKTILKNINAIKKKLAPGTKFCAVVKANAYGFGAVKISHLIEPHVDCFAVANLAEGLTLRRAGIRKDILIFGVTTDVVTAMDHNLIITVNSSTTAQSIAKWQLQPRVHIAVNTDMNRYGVNLLYELRATLQALTNAKVEGLYTHLAFEAEQRPRVMTALTKFQKYVALFKKYCPNGLIHAGCSGVIDYLPAHYQMVRIGKALYGGTAGTETVFTVQSRIMAIKKLKPGDSVGYQGTYTATKPMVVGIVPGGYAQGITPAWQNTNSAKVEHQFCQLIGRVCMDCCFLDVTHITNPLGKKVTFIAPHAGQTLMDVAAKTKQIPCQILLALRHENA